VKARVLSLDSAEHRSAQELLPWFLNGTLGDAEAASVARHLGGCERCRKDAAEQAQLKATASSAAEPGGDVDRDWAALRSRIEAIPRPPSRKRAAATAQPWRRWLPLTLAIQGVFVVALLLVVIGGPLRDERYRALGAAPTAVEANAVAVFRSDATNRQMREALHAVGATIVGGPTVTDAYLLRVANATPEVLARLKAQPGVLSAEALQAETSR
jgi:anti-sigma factor RsiW